MVLRDPKPPVSKALRVPREIARMVERPGVKRAMEREGVKPYGT